MDQVRINKLNIVLHSLMSLESKFVYHNNLFVFSNQHVHAQVVLRLFITISHAW